MSFDLAQAVELINVLRQAMLAATQMQINMKPNQVN